MFHVNLKRLRQGCALTQKQVSDVLKINRSTYTYYETGKSQPTIRTLIKLSKMFNVTIDFLLGIEDDKSNNAVNNFSDNVLSYKTGEGYNSLDEDEKVLLMSFRLLSDVSKKKIVNAIEEMINAND